MAGKIKKCLRACRTPTPIRRAVPLDLSTECTSNPGADAVRIQRAQIEKARRRAAGLDLTRLADTSKDKTPQDLAPADAQENRRDLLARTFGDTRQTELVFERLIAGNELQPVNYLPHGIVAGRPVCRLTLTEPHGWATGFLIAPGVLLTNNHVFPSAQSARSAMAEFDLELDVFDRLKTPVAFGLNPDRLFLTSTVLDYSVVAVEERSANGASLDGFGYLPLIASTGKAIEGEWLTIIQHPAGQPKQLCIRENQLLKRMDDVLWYSTDTLPGTSGAPVYNNTWQVVALHHSGVPDTKNGVMQTVDARDFDPGRDDESAVKWIANEGIRVSRLVEDLKRARPNEPMLEPVFNMTPERAQSIIDGYARAVIGQGAVAASPIASVVATTLSGSKPAMGPRSITITLDIDDDGRVAVRQQDGATESFVDRQERESSTAPAARPPEYNVPFDLNYGAGGARKGYDPVFLGPNFSVPLPDLGSLKSEATQLLGQKGKYVLDYRGYSLVMHAKRKLAIYTAANVNGGSRFKLGRPHDEWRYDPRIDRSAQIGDYYYAKNQFDRGHLTRYEDMEYGASVTDALQSAADTLHFTNCSMQHAKFNQTKALWQGLEQHVLEQSVKANTFAAQVLTGPVLDPGDPVWERFKDVQYPLRFWKIAVAVTSAQQLFAAGFILDQSDVVDRYGIEAAVEVPFSEFKTYQVPIEEIERLTGLTFPAGKSQALQNFDPLKSGSSARSTLSRRPRTTESASGETLPGYVTLSTRDDIVLG